MKPRSLGELLQATEVKVTAPTRVDGRVRKASSQNGSLCSQAINVPKAKGVSRDVLEILDELLFGKTSSIQWLVLGDR